MFKYFFGCDDNAVAGCDAGTNLGKAAATGADLDLAGLDVAFALLKDRDLPRPVSM
jgi:hypothetical protein